MSRALTWIRVVLTGMAATALIACTPIYQNHGYTPTELELAAITVGKDTRETVGAAIGRPTAAGMLNPSAWYYVQSRWKTFGARAPQEIEREVVAISFSASGRVENVERFGLEDGRVVALSRRVTDSNIKGVSFLKQMLGNLGNFQADQFLK